MKLIEEYYEKNVKKWVDIAKELHQAGVEGKDITQLIKESQFKKYEFQLKDVHPIDLELIVEYFRRFDTVERDHVWKGSPANPIYKAAVVAQAFLDSYNHATDPKSYMGVHYKKKGEKRAIEEIHETVEIARGFYKTLERLLPVNHSERKKQYSNLISGIYNNEIVKQIGSIEVKELKSNDSQFNKDIEIIARDGFSIVNNFFNSSPLYAVRDINTLFKEINEDNIDTNYKNKPFQRRIMEELLVEIHMIQTAIKDFLYQQKINDIKYQ